MKRVKKGFSLQLPAELFPGETNLFRCSAGSVIDDSHPFEDHLLRGQKHKLEDIESSERASPIVDPRLAAAFLAYERRVANPGKHPTVRETMADKTDEVYALAKNKLSEIPEPDDSVIMSRVQADKLRIEVDKAKQNTKAALKAIENTKAYMTQCEKTLKGQEAALAGAQEIERDLSEEFGQAGRDFQAHVERTSSERKEALADAEAAAEKREARQTDADQRYSKWRKAIEEANQRANQIVVEYKDLIQAAEQAPNDDLLDESEEVLAEWRAQEVSKLNDEKDAKLMALTETDTPVLRELQAEAELAAASVGT